MIPTFCLRVTGEQVRAAFGYVDLKATRDWIQTTLGKTLTARRNAAYREYQTKSRDHDVLPLRRSAGEDDRSASPTPPTSFRKREGVGKRSPADRLNTDSSVRPARGWTRKHRKSYRNKAARPPNGRGQESVISRNWNSACAANQTGGSTYGSRYALVSIEFALSLPGNVSVAGSKSRRPVVRNAISARCTRPHDR